MKTPSKQPKHPSEEGLREKNGKWEYRFYTNGEHFSLVTDLEAVPENIAKVQALRQAHIEDVKNGKKHEHIKNISIPLSESVPEFMKFYRSEHGNRPCKWPAVC